MVLATRQSQLDPVWIGDYSCDCESFSVWPRHFGFSQCSITTSARTMNMARFLKNGSRRGLCSLQQNEETAESFVLIRRTADLTNARSLKPQWKKNGHIQPRYPEQAELNS
jgi:hypothetical protein